MCSQDTRPTRDVGKETIHVHEYNQTVESMYSRIWGRDEGVCEVSELSGIEFRLWG